MNDAHNNNDNNGDFFDQLRRQHSSMASSELEPTQAVEPTPPIAPSTSDAVPSPNPASQAMPPDAKRALVHLLRQGVVLAERNAGIFDSVCRYQKALREHLANMYLGLTLDDKTGIAFVRSIEDTTANNKTSDAYPNHSDYEPDDVPDDEPVSLITRRTLSLFDTLLLLVLRKHYQEREASGEQKVIIDIERVESNMSPFLALTNSAGADRRKLGTAMKKMTEKRILSVLRGSEDRFEITPLIRYVVDAAFLETMLGEYLRLAEEAGLEIDPQQEDLQ